MTTQISDVFRSNDIVGETSGSLPLTEHPGLLHLKEIYVPKDDAELGRYIGSTACYCGYMAEWRLTESRLFLTKVIGYYKLAGAAPLFADWYSEWMVVDHGDLLSHSHFPRQPPREKCTAFRFEGGHLVDQQSWTADLADLQSHYFQRRAFLGDLRSGA
jgi:hypothetical protein